MKTNKVAPYEGKLIWLGEMRQGTSQRGTDWQSIDFVIEYPDGQRNKNILFNAFGAEKVGLLMATAIGTKLLVEWEPEARESNGKWWGKNAALDIKVADATPETAKQPLPDGAVIHPGTGAPTFPNASSATAEDKDEDLPFNRAPGVRG